MEEKKVTAAEPQVPQNPADDEQVTAVELEPVKSSSIVKFVIASAVGVFLFLIPIPQGNTFTIPVGIVINWVKALLATETVDLSTIAVLVFVTVSTLLTRHFFRKTKDCKRFFRHHLYTS